MVRPLAIGYSFLGLRTIQNDPNQTRLMMKKLLQFSFSITLVFVFVFSASAQKTINKITKNEVIKIGMTGDQPPYCMEDKDGELIGFEVDIANLLAESMGIKLEIVQMPFKDLLTILEAGKIDAILSCMTITM